MARSTSRWPTAIRRCRYSSAPGTAVLEAGSCSRAGSTPVTWPPATSTLPSGVHPCDVAAGDLNGDGKQDLVVANYMSNTVSVLFGLGSGSFSPKMDLVTGAGPLGVVIGDLNADGRPDIEAATYAAHTVTVLLGTGGGNFGAKSEFAT